MQESPELHAAACEHFGTWSTALKYAGISLRRKSANPAYTPQEVVRILRHLCSNGYNLSAQRNKRRDRRLHESARKHFGSWRDALQAAGINVHYATAPVNSHRFSRSQIIEAIQQRHEAGLSLSWSATCRENRALAVAAKHYFRSWRLALVAAGVAAEKTEPSNHNDPSPDQ